jgi:hypothetical protein
VRTLVAVATGSGRIALRVVVGAALTIFFLAYAALGLLLLPLVATALGIAALPRLARELSRRLGGRVPGARVAIRSMLVGWLSLGR